MKHIHPPPAPNQLTIIGLAAIVAVVAIVALYMGSPFRAKADAKSQQVEIEIPAPSR